MIAVTQGRCATVVMSATIMVIIVPTVFLFFDPLPLTLQIFQAISDPVETTLNAGTIMARTTTFILQIGPFTTEIIDLAIDLEETVSTAIISIAVMANGLIYAM